MSKPIIFYTKTDEAPALATYSLLPILRVFTRAAGVEIALKDISLAARIIASFPENLHPKQRIENALYELGQLAKTPSANIIKLPNISASIPQMKAAIAELQSKGYALPDYPNEPQDDAEKKVKARYDKIKGSAVNPILREGNSDRRAPAAVKAFARAHPHSMGVWSKESRTKVATMTKGDFRSSEQSITLSKATQVRIEFVAKDGSVSILKDSICLLEGEIIDAAVMHRRALIAFFESQIARAKREGLLFSLHLKATMMKVSDPILFGICVKSFFKKVITKHRQSLDAVGVDFRNGLSELFAKIKILPEKKQAEICDDIDKTLATNPLAMVDFVRRITNLHVPNDVIIDASMPAMIRNSGQMQNAKGEWQDTLAIIPDSSYAAIYQAAIDHCREHGAFDPSTMGSVANVGLMAQKAEEYGSHDKTFQATQDGRIRIIDASGKVLTEHKVEKGDLWRACQTKKSAIENWIKLAMIRARAMDCPVIFWLDATRSHDAQLITKVNCYLAEHSTKGLDICILSPLEAMRISLSRIARGENILSATGNVLRDYLTDLFPILELGTSAKMLSIVPLLHGGGLFETGAGGSAPKHVQQFQKENYLRWDSLGEFLALAASLEHLGAHFDNAKASLLSRTLDIATQKFLTENKSPTRKIGSIDNRGSHFYLAFYWAQTLAAQDADAELKAFFTPIAERLATNESKILEELIGVQGNLVEIGGYYLPDDSKVSAAMRPSKTLNKIIN